MNTKKIIFLIAASLTLSSEARVKHANILTWGGLNFGSWCDIKSCIANKTFGFSLLILLKCTYEHKFMFGGNIPTVIIGGRFCGSTASQFRRFHQNFHLLTLKLGLEWTYSRKENGRWFGGDIAINGGLGYYLEDEDHSFSIPCFISCNIFKWRSQSGFYGGICLLTVDIVNLIQEIREMELWLSYPSLSNLGINLGYDFSASTKADNDV